MAKKKVFVSFDYEKDKQYYYLLKAWDANSNFEFSFSDYTSREIQSDSIPVVKANLTNWNRHLTKIMNKNMKERLYLDNCSFNRPYGDQSVLKNYLESEAKTYIQKEILNETYELAMKFHLIHFWIEKVKL